MNSTTKMRTERKHFFPFASFIVECTWKHDQNRCSSQNRLMPSSRTEGQHISATAFSRFEAFAIATPILTASIISMSLSPSPKAIASSLESPYRSSIRSMALPFPPSAGMMSTARYHQAAIFACRTSCRTASYSSLRHPIMI